MKIRISKILFFNLWLCLFTLNCLFSPAVQDQLTPEKEENLTSLVAFLLAGNATGLTETNETVVATPTFSPRAGYYSTPQEIAISTSTSGATIFFTTDGSNPTTSSNIYSGSVGHIWSLAGRNIKAFATKTGLVDSATLSGVFSYPPIKSGQSTVYVTGDNGTNQTGANRGYNGPSAHVTYTSDYTTTDTASGLVWKTCTQGLSGATCASGSANTMNWSDAQSGGNGCNLLNSANSGNGYSGIKTWRLPSRYELESLPDYNTSIPSINVTAFPATVTAGEYSSLTTYAPDSTSAWNVSFAHGMVGSTPKSNNLLVRCVSGNSKDYRSNFTDQSNGTIKDNNTGLVWQKCSRGQSVDATCSGSATTQTWASALAYCTGLSLAEKSWRLPHVNELKTIVDTTRATSPNIDSSSFPSTVSVSYWTSSTYFQGTTFAWTIAFGDGGGVSIGTKSDGANYYTRCVSGP